MRMHTCIHKKALVVTNKAVYTVEVDNYFFFCFSSTNSVSFSSLFYAFPVVDLHSLAPLSLGCRM